MHEAHCVAHGFEGGGGSIDRQQNLHGDLPFISGGQRATKHAARC